MKVNLLNFYCKIYQILSNCEVFCRMETFRDILSDYLVDNEMSIRTFSKKCGVSLTNCSTYLKGVVPNIKNAERLAIFFNCSLDYLFGLSNTKKMKEYKNINMSLFLPRYDELLLKNGISNRKFLLQNGMSDSSRKKWVKGDIPKITTLITIAYELGSSIDYLTGRI